ncbi:Glycoside Hydrolase Family 27 protein [Gigaspora rosea]|uniref:Alpha-galactosidase n=1 Tax=Gigaspora rosea TaxID=44941 RepID=A0A397VGV5_9GLOM|nr:Glycoside Hydrolase Family 27 protein [Gigaspora rosea]
MRMFISLFIIIFATIVSCLDNGLGKTPPMGWNSYNHFNCSINETLIKSIADAMIKYGFRNAGYTYLNLDYCWQNKTRDKKTNRLIPDPKAFPKGIKDLANYVHNKGLLFGIYGDAGTADCANRPGSLGFEELDAQTFADWGVDYLKYDNCHNNNIDPIIRYSKMRDALKATNRPIYYSICNWGEFDPHIWGKEVGNSWRTTVDIYHSWESILFTLDKQRNISTFSSPGGWNDPDMLEIGNAGLTFDEQKSHFSLWAALKAPLLLGFDLRNPPKNTLAVALNEKIIAVNQDPLGQSVKIVDFVDDIYEIWTGPLSDGYVAVLFNRLIIPYDITLNFETHCGLNGTIAVTDLWDDDPFKGNFTDSYTSQVPSHGVTVLKLQVVDNKFLD